MANTDLEAKVEAALDNGAKALGGSTRKVKWIGRRGAPDRLVLLPRYGYSAYVELKRPTSGVLEPHQQREHKTLREAGIDVFVILNEEQVDAFFQRIIQHGKPNW